MSYPYFAKGLPGQLVSRPADEIPTLDRTRAESPVGYVPHPDLSHAVNVALVLGMPLLVTGEPGTGKTQLAYAIANDLKCDVHKFETKSTSSSRDLFYTFDAMSSFKMRDVTDQRMFIRYQALGRAILDAFPRTNPKIVNLLPPDEGTSDYRHQGPRRSVVLIDEIDKAPRDFPNDLLNEMERLYFRVPELHNAGSPGSDPGEDGVVPRYRPIVILTSNSEKGLPDPFLRRCVYFDIPFPTEEEMQVIISNRIVGLRPTDKLLKSAIDLFYRLRHEKRETSLKKEPSTAEFLNWIQILMHRGVVPGQSLKERGELVLETMSTLVKNAEDRREARDFVGRWVKSNG